MGIHGLNDILKKFGKINTVSLSRYSGQKVTVDVNIYLHQFVYNTYNKGKGSHIRGFFEMIVAFKKNGVEPIFIFDGRAPTAKGGTLESRFDIKQNKYSRIENLVGEIIAIAKKSAVSNGETAVETEVPVDLESLLAHTDNLSADDLKLITEKQAEIEKIDKTIIKVNSSMYSDLKELFEYTGVPYYVASGEADALCVAFCKCGIAAAVFSEDMDILAHGSPVLVRGINSNGFRKEGQLNEYNLTELLTELNLSHDQFIDVCILCGCDYCGKIEKVGSITALKLVRQYHDLENIVSKIHRKELPYECGDNFGVNFRVAQQLFKTLWSAENAVAHDLVVKPPNYDILQTFLTTKSNYTTKTVAKKFSELPRSGGSSLRKKIVIARREHR